MATQFYVPDEIELLEFFGTDPVGRDVGEGFWSYYVSDERGVGLRLAFNIYERSVETKFSVGGQVSATVSHEGADRMVIRDGRLECEFSTAGEKTMLTVEVGRGLSAAWSSLRTQ